MPCEGCSGDPCRIHNPFQLIICTFDGAEKAEVVREAIEALDAQLDAIKLGNIAVVKKDEDGRIVFYETAERRVEAVSMVAGVAVKGVTWLLYNIAGMLGLVAGPLAGRETKAMVESLRPKSAFPTTRCATSGNAWMPANPC